MRIGILDGIGHRRTLGTQKTDLLRVSASGIARIRVSGSGLANPLTALELTFILAN